MNDIQYIDTPGELEQLCQAIKNEPWITVDTEFLREKTYYPKFCLLQLAAPSWVACVDPLALPDLDRLFAALNSPDIVKVFHSCRQDQEIFYHLTGTLLQPIFDTQVAAPLLGFQESPGYGMLVSGLLNINLTKAYTRTDWSVRPLSREQIKYAADDVIYLAEIYQIIMRKLTELGRVDWLQEDFAQLTDLRLYQSAPENAWLKMKGRQKLTGRQLSIIQVLTEWRERTAQRENRPRNWLMRDDLLLNLAKLQPTSLAQLSDVHGINDGIIRRHGKKLCRLIEDALDRPPVKADNGGRPLKKTPQQEAVLDVLNAIVRVRAEQNSLNPSILATRKDLEKLLFEDPDCALLHGWRSSMVGEELRDVLEGRLLLSLRRGEIDITSNPA